MCILGSVRCIGKGRKERCTPLTKTTAAVLKTWLAEPSRDSTETLFPTAHGGRLSPDSVKDLLDKHVALARQTCPSLRAKRVTPHVLRHYLPFLTMSCPAAAPAFDRHSPEALPT